MSAEQNRLYDHYINKSNWLQWGPYLSERQWGTVREDYSANGDAWNEVTHDMARSKAYRWGEEGIAGFSDDKQLICLGLGLWNGKDPILKERLFGLTNSQGNHGEDVKELYYYLDSTPTHSYMKMLYKYTQDAYPYEWLIEENGRRGKSDPEFELIDTGLFNESRYFDVFVEYAKQSENDILIKYTIHNRGTEASSMHLLPQVWFRNTWNQGTNTNKPEMNYQGNNTLALRSPTPGEYYLYADGNPEFIFTENETNNERLYQSQNVMPFVKDGINNRVVNNDLSAVNPLLEGTKSALWYQFLIPAGESVEVNLRLTTVSLTQPFEEFDFMFSKRKEEADLYYAEKQIKINNPDEKLVHRQACAGLLWSKQYFLYDVNLWLNGDPGQTPPPSGRQKGRNYHWGHFFANNIISMPDKWEFPWFAAWDLAFHCMAFSAIDPDFAKGQLLLLIDDCYIHPSGQLPAYEWDFGDVNPPVHAQAALQVYTKEKADKEKGDLIFLEKVFQKLLLNFTWWVNQKDSKGNNVFEGGFLGLDNIGIFNRSAPVPGGGLLEQADGTSWMAMYALNMLQISNELALDNSIYELMSVKFAEHFLFIAGSMKKMGKDTVGLWDDEDEFYYDLLRKPDGRWDRLRLRSMVGLIPLFAVTVFNDSSWEKLPLLKAKLIEFQKRRPDLTELVSNWRNKSGDNQHLFSLLRGHRMKMLLRRMLDPLEFLSPYGIRSLSKIYEDEPFHYKINDTEFSVTYTPGESISDMFGGNSNWRGPIWMPLNYLIIDSLYKFHSYYTDDFKVEFPTGSGAYISLHEIADQLKARLKNIFLKTENEARAVTGGNAIFNEDPFFKDLILFHEYFHGDTGKGLGASHQTGWTGLIALL
jgi:hypothetical protein